MNVVVVMPAYEPSPELPGRVRRLQDELDAPVVVVDDGSCASCRPLFDEVAGMPGCTVLRHGVNRGKGAALKTAYSFAAENLQDSFGVIAVDADGQHAPEDCRRLAEALMEGPRALYLGVRDLSLGKTPFRSWWGNRWTSLEFVALFGLWVPDTQTGLRAFRMSDVPFFLSIPGDGYEYEMAALGHAARAALPFRMLAIRTIYDAGNASSHFCPFRDTVRIHRSLYAARFGQTPRMRSLAIDSAGSI